MKLVNEENKKVTLTGKKVKIETKMPKSLFRLRNHNYKFTDKIKKNLIN